MTHRSRVLVPSVAFLMLALTIPAGAAPPPASKPDNALPIAESPGSPKPIDINSASLSDLISLPGIGTANARKIVAGRPYASPDDLKTRKVVPISTYEKIRHRISATPARGAATGEHPETMGSTSSKH